MSIVATFMVVLKIRKIQLTVVVVEVSFGGFEDNGKDICGH